MRRLEPLVAGALGVATGWVGVVASADAGAIWLSVLAALAIAGWGRSFPATSHWLMLARALLLLCIALGLHLEPDQAGPGGDFFFWLPVIAVAYALLLDPRLAGGVLVMCAAEFLLAFTLKGQQGQWRSVFIDIGTLLIFGSTALMFGRSILRSELQVEATLTDAHSGLYNKAGLFLYGTELLQECLRSDRAMTMVLLNCRDLGDVRELLGREAASRMFSEAVKAVARTAPRAGLAARTDRLEFVLVLPGLTNARSKELVQSVLGTPPKLALKSAGRQLEIVMEVTVGSLGKGIATMEELYELLQAKLQHRRHPAHLTTEAGESVMDESGGPLSRLELSPTLPMPLG